MNKNCLEIKGSESIDQWIEIIRNHRYHNLSNNSICIDLRLTGFIKPFQLVMLACLLEEYKKNKKPIDFWINSESKACTYLESIDFIKYWSDSYDRKSIFQNNRFSTIPLWNVERDYIDNYILMSKLHYSEIINKDLHPLFTIFTESFNNISDHSDSEIKGFILSQYFGKNETIEIAICDFGVGIPEKVNNYRKTVDLKSLKTYDAIELALRKGYSTKSTPHNKGLGLDNIHSIVKSIAGHLTIVSSSGFWEKQNDYLPVKKLLRGEFPGTLINITLNCKQFNVREDELIDELLML